MGVSMSDAFRRPHLDASKGIVSLPTYPPAKPTKPKPMKKLPSKRTIRRGK